MGLTDAARAFVMRALDAVPPLTPDGDEARDWAERELADPVYEAAQPTPLDRIARAIGEFFARLFDIELQGGWGSAFALIAGIVVVVLIIAAFLVWGVPRATRRAPAAATALFGEHDERSAAELRRASAAHARNGEWDAAIVLRFRGLARGCLERGVVETPPGATVHAFARAAARAFPGEAAALEEAAVAFDDVRYLRRPGTAALYDRVAAVDDRVASARPVSPESVPA